MEMLYRASITEIMSSPRILAERNQRPSEVHQMMNNAPFHHIPIVEDNSTKLIGIVSSTDFLRVMFNDIDTQRNDDLLDRRFPTIMDIMPKNKAGDVELKTIKNNDTVHEAAHKLMEGGFHSLPVVDEDGNIVGIVTSTDLIMYLYTIRVDFQHGKDTERMRRNP